MKSITSFGKFTIIIGYIICVKCDYRNVEQLIDMICRTNNDCYQFNKNYVNATCINGTCSCSNTDLEIVKCDMNDSEPMNNKVGGKCPCKIENSICTLQNDCICEKNFTASIDLLRCIPSSVSLFDKCEINTQCIKNDLKSLCDPKENVCKCQKNYTLYNGICQGIVGLGKVCEDHVQCRNHTDHSICLQRHCICESGYVASAYDHCLPEADHGENCTENIQCHQTGMICDSGICVCDSNHFKINGFSYDKSEILCEKRISVGSVCNEHNDCYQYHVMDGEQTMLCFLNACVCKKGYIVVNHKCTTAEKGSAAGIVETLTLILSCLIINLLNVN